MAKIFLDQEAMSRPENYKKAAADAMQRAFESAAAFVDAQVMQRALGLQLQEAKLAAQPILIWGNGSANNDVIEWEFTNEGGPISHLTIAILSPTGAQTGIQATINPTEWLGTSRKGGVTLQGKYCPRDSIFGRLSNSHRRCRRLLFPDSVARSQTDFYRQR